MGIYLELGSKSYEEEGSVLVEQTRKGALSILAGWQ